MVTHRVTLKVVDIPLEDCRGIRDVRLASREMKDVPIAEPDSELDHVVETWLKLGLESAVRLQTLVHRQFKLACL